MSFLLKYRKLLSYGVGLRSLDSSLFIQANKGLLEFKRRILCVSFLVEAIESSSAS